MSIRHQTFVMPELHPSITRGVIFSMNKARAKLGACTACGTLHNNIDPDARKLPCDWCEDYNVCGYKVISRVANYYTIAPVCDVVSKTVNRQLDLFF